MQQTTKLALYFFNENKNMYYILKYSFISPLDARSAYCIHILVDNLGPNLPSKYAIHHMCSDSFKELWICSISRTKHGSVTFQFFNATKVDWSSHHCSG